jgi:hypothetical protein
MIFMISCWTRPARRQPERFPRDPERSRAFAANSLLYRAAGVDQATLLNLHLRRRHCARNFFCLPFGIDAIQIIKSVMKVNKLVNVRGGSSSFWLLRQRKTLEYTTLVPESKPMKISGGPLFGAFGSVQERTLSRCTHLELMLPCRRNGCVIVHAEAY